MFRRSPIILFTLIFSFGCTQFHMGRSFVGEMAQDDGRFFSPNEDFPVVAGDNGDFGLGADEFKKRAPLTAEDLRDQRYNKTLHRELRMLEDSQSEDSAALYERHKKQFSSTSEKIYFLQLPPYERKQYLEARGLYLDKRAPASTRAHAVNFGVRKNEIGLGMNKTDVTSSLGHPLRVEVAGNPSNENERWAYSINGQTKYVYFESGLVQGWE